MRAHESADYVEWDLFLDGEFMTGASEGWGRRDVENPVVRSTIGSAPSGTAASVDAAIDDAERAYEETKRLVPGRERVEYFLVVADRIEAVFDGFVYLETPENGKPLYESENDVGEAVDCYGNCAASRSSCTGRRHRSGTGSLIIPCANPTASSEPSSRGMGRQCTRQTSLSSRYPPAIP